MDTFEVFRKGGKKPMFYGSIQISLAPDNERADAMFFPHVAVILYHADQYGKNRNWVAEKDFILEDEFLSVRNSYGNIWIADEDSHWRGLRWVAQGVAGCIAFVVPLVDLRDENDVKNKIIDSIAKEITNFANSQK